MTKIIRSAQEMFEHRKSLAGKSVGFVPTMGALHQGHAELLKKSKKENEISILSIFVNPTQFNDENDFKNYPITQEADLKIAQNCAVDILFSPDRTQIYPQSYRYMIKETGLSQLMEGKHRPGHFEGMLTVVMKLLQLTSPTKAYFGEKDYQQLLLVKSMVADFFMNTEICPVPTVREADGLAMSSRNVRLSAAGRKRAPAIYQAISKATNAAQAVKLLIEQDIEVEYVEDHFSRRFVAAKIDQVRLIDNVAI